MLYSIHLANVRCYNISSTAYAYCAQCHYGKSIVRGPYVNTMYPTPYPYYCGGNLAANTIRFIFNLLSAFIFIAVGCYMMLNGKKL